MPLVPVVSEVAGALAAGALVFLVARQVGVGVQSALCAVAVVPVAVAALVAVPALRDGARTLLDQRKVNAPLTNAEAQLQPGAALGMNVAFLEWVEQQLAEGDTFHMEIGAIPEEVYVGGKGARQDAILQWSLFQLAPHLAVEQSDTGRDLKPGEGLGADWLVFYESDPAAYPAGPLGEVITYEPSFAIARAGVAR
jgi:hypothetical protein